MSAVTQDTAVSTGRVTRAFIYLVLLLFALFYLLPLYVMGVNSLKPLDEITGGNMMALPSRMDAGPVALGLVHRADRGRADGPEALFPELDPDGRPRRRDLAPSSAR